VNWGDEIKAALNRVLASRLADVPDDDLVRAQAICDQLAAELTAGFTERGMPPPAPIVITVIGPGQVRFGFADDV
jgi:hypothetical protein